MEAGSTELTMNLAKGQAAQASHSCNGLFQWAELHGCDVAAPLNGRPHVAMRRAAMRGGQPTAARIYTWPPVPGDAGAAPPGRRVR